MNFLKQNLLWIITGVVVITCVVLTFTVVQAKEAANKRELDSYASLGSKARQLLSGELYNDKNIADAKEFRKRFSRMRAACLADQRKRSDALHKNFFMMETNTEVPDRHPSRYEVPDGHEWKLVYARKIEELRDYADEKLQAGQFINYFKNFGAAAPTEEEIRYYYTLYWITRSLIDALDRNRLEMGLNQVTGFSIGAGRGAAGDVSAFMGGGMGGPMGPMGPMGAAMPPIGPAAPGAAKGARSLRPPLTKDGFRKYPYEVHLVISSARIPQMISALLSADLVFDIESIGFARTADPLRVSVPIPRVNVVVKGNAVVFEVSPPKSAGGRN